MENDDDDDDYDDGTYDQVGIQDMVREAFPLRNVNERTRNEGSGGTDVITNIQNPYYCDANFDITDVPEGNT